MPTRIPSLRRARLRRVTSSKSFLGRIGLVSVDQTLGQADQTLGQADQALGQADQALGQADQTLGQADQAALVKNDARESWRGRGLAGRASMRQDPPILYV